MWGNVAVRSAHHAPTPTHGNPPHERTCMSDTSVTVSRSSMRPVAEDVDVSTSRLSDSSSSDTACDGGSSTRTPQLPPLPAR